MAAPPHQQTAALDPPEPWPSSLPRVLGLLMVVLALVGLSQSLRALWAPPDFELYLLLGDRAGRWQRFETWNHATGLLVGALHLAAGGAALVCARRAPLWATLYAGGAILRVGGVLLLYSQTLAPTLRPVASAPLARGYDAGLLLHSALLLVWAAGVAIALNLRSAKEVCGRSLNTA